MLIVDGVAAIIFALGGAGRVDGRGGRTIAERRDYTRQLMMTALDRLRITATRRAAPRSRLTGDATARDQVERWIVVWADDNDDPSTTLHWQAARDRISNNVASYRKP